MRDIPVVAARPTQSSIGTGPSIAAMAPPAIIALWVLVTAMASSPACSGVDIGNGFDHVACISPF